MLSWEITRPGGQDRQQGPSWDQQQHRRFSTLISSTAGRPGGQAQGPESYRRFFTLISTAGRPGKIAGRLMYQGSTPFPLPSQKEGQGPGSAPKIFYTYQQHRKTAGRLMYQGPGAGIGQQRTFSPTCTAGRPRKAQESRPRGRKSYRRFFT